MRALAAFLLVTALPALAFAQIGGGDPVGDDTAVPGLPQAPDAAPTATSAADDVGAPAATADATTASADQGIGFDDDLDSVDDLYVADRAPALTGATGLLRTYQATGLRPGTFGLFLETEFFKGTDVVRRGDEARRFIGHLGLSYTPIDLIEVFIDISARAVTNTLGDPRLVQSVGDIGFGSKVFSEVGDGVHLGVLLRLQFPAGSNTVGLEPTAINVEALALMTTDFREIADFPLRAHLNVGYLVDNDKNLFPFLLERVERFGHGVYDYSRILVGVSLDVPVDYVTPFVEWTTEFPTGAACDPIDQPCVTDNGLASYPAWITLGLRSQPVAGLSFNAGFDIGLTTAESQGTPAVPGWNVLAGLAYNLDPSGTRVVQRTVEVPTGGATSYVEGVVQDAETGAPIDGARIRYLETDYTDQITATDGHFRTFDFAPGSELTIEVSHPEYQMRAMRVLITEEVLSGPIDLVPAFVGTRLTGTATASSDADITVSLRGPESHDVAVEDGEFQVDATPGEYTLTVWANGFESIRETVTLSEGREQRAWALTAVAPGTAFQFRPDGITIVDSERQVTFDARGNLTPDSRTILDELAALLAADQSIELLVRAHTDPRDDPAEELVVTGDRADAVVEYVVSKGIASTRLGADGVGAAEPLFPNVTERNRRQNNRVGFQFGD